MAGNNSATGNWTYMSNYPNLNVGYTRPGGATGGPFWHILPYIEQDNMYKWPGSGNFGYWTQWSTGGLTPKIMVASGDPTYQQGTAATSYLYNATAMGNGWNSWGVNPRWPASIQDGTSQTMAYTEGYSKTWSWGQPRTWCDGNNYFALQNVWTWGTSSGGPNPAFQVKPTIQSNPDGTLPQSFSTAGIQASMFDGSVRLVSSAVSYTTFASACTPAGGEILPSDW